MADPVRVAVRSDIHGNLPPLEAVLAEADRLGIDRFVLNGDLADGPFPVETLERLHDLGERPAHLLGGSRHATGTRPQHELR